MNVSSLLIWYLTLQGFAVAGAPLAFVWLRHLPSRGYAAAKALGLLLSGVILWWGATLHLWPNTAAAAVAAAMALLVIGLLILRGEWDAVITWWREHWRFALVTELLFALMFLAWAAVRSSQPQIAISGGEKWMEIAFLNAVLRSPTMPPHDPWLSGFAISYYYLGYLLLGMLARVSGIPSTVAFNLGNAAWFALAAIVAYGIVYDLTEGTRAVKALFAPLLLLIAGNASGILQVIRGLGWLPSGFWTWLDIKGLNMVSPGPTGLISAEDFDWWQGSRILHDYAPIGTAENRISQEVIDEFPAFSFVLGDMHPHLLALPFVLLAISLALNYWKSTSGHDTAARSLCDRLRALGPWLGVAAVLGALGFLNTWDFPIYWALFVAVAILKHRATMPEGTLLDATVRFSPAAVALAVISVALYAPFWFALRSQAGGILPNVFNATRLPQFLVMFSPLILPLIGVIVRAAKKAHISWIRVFLWSVFIIGALTLAGLLAGWFVGSPYLAILRQGQPIPGLGMVEVDVVRDALVARLLNPWTALLLTAGCVTLFLALLPPSRVADPNRVFVGVLALLGLGLTLAPEYVFLKDVFSTRMNTIFKFYFQAWVLWSLAGAWWFATARILVGTWLKRGAIVAAWMLVAVSLVYTGFAIPARAGQNRGYYGGEGTLDGAAWLAERQTDDWDAITWLNRNVSGRAVIAEAPGDQRAYIYEGRVSAFTGLPALLGWGSHQMQWRGNYDEPALREAALDTLYAGLDEVALREVLVRYEVAYIYFGPSELARYTEASLERLAGLFPVVYRNPGVTIFQVTPP